MLIFLITGTRFRTDSEFLSLMRLSHTPLTAAVLTLKKRVKMTQDFYEQRQN